MMMRNLIIAILLSVPTLVLGSEKLLDLPMNGTDKKTAPIEYLKTAGLHSERGGKRSFLRFDGLGSYMTIPAEKATPKIFSVCFWIMPTLKGSSFNAASIFQSGNVEGSGWRRGFSIFGKAESGQFRISLVMSGDKGFKSFSLPQISANKFTFIMFSWNGSHVKGIINSKEVLNEKWNGSLRYSDNKRPACIGARGYSKFPFYGILANFKLLRGVLSEADFLRIYKTEKDKMRLTLSKVSLTDSTYIASDKLNMPDRTIVRNLLENPSFEAGFRWWQAAIPSNGVILTAPATIDASVAYSGDRSMRLEGLPNQRELVQINALPVIVTPGNYYTVSFYAKSNIQVQLNVTIYSGYWPVFPANKHFLITNKWRRFSLTFKAPNAVACPKFSIQRNPSSKCSLWIDDVQMENGKSATDFVKKPVDIELISDSRGNVVVGNEKANARLRIHTENPGMSGDCEITIYDYKKKIVSSRIRKFNTDSNGECLINMQELDHLLKGLYSIRVAYSMKNGIRDCDFFRFGKISPMRKQFKLKHFFGGNLPTRFPTTKDSLDLFELFGLGWNKNFGLISQKYADVLARRHIVARGFLFYTKASYLPLGVDGYVKPKFDVYGKDRKNREAFYVRSRLNENLNYVVESTVRIVKKHPWITEWQTCGEGLVIGDYHRLEKTKKYMELHRKIAAAIKKINPRNRLYSVSTTNLYPSGGIKQIEETMRCGAGDIFDVITAHTYRPYPENPDLDNDLAVFIRMLSKYNCKKEISIEEDMNYPSYVIPQLGLEPTKFADFWRGRALSYDIGLGERISAAYNARTWLIALKYYPRVVRMFWHLTTSAVMDAKGTLRVAPWTSNTIANLFGDGIHYVARIDISDDIRCYLYKDSENNPVAALWNINEDVDREKRKPFTFSMPFKEEEADVVDIFNNQAPAKFKSIIEILPMPMFIRGRDLNLNAFKRKMESIKVNGSPLRLVNIACKLASEQSLTVQVANRLSKTSTGTLAVSLNGNKLIKNKNIYMAPLESKSLCVVSETPFKNLDHVSLDVAYNGNGEASGQNTKFDFMYLASGYDPKNIRIDGELSDWGTSGWIDITARRNDHKPSVKLLRQFPTIPKWNGEQDLSVKFKTKWNEKFFYLALNIKDDKFTPLPSNRSDFWNFDSLQVYFDTFADARSHRNKGYDSNDYCYNFYMKNGHFIKNRNQVPDWQLCFLDTGIAEKVKAVFKRTPDGYVYEIAWPATELSPLSLTSGTTMGFTLLVNENDDDYRKREVSLTPKGTSPYQKPHLWPMLILTGGKADIKH